MTVVGRCGVLLLRLDLYTYVALVGLGFAMTPGWPPTQRSTCICFPSECISIPKKVLQSLNDLTISQKDKPKDRKGNCSFLRVESKCSFIEYLKKLLSLNTR